MNFNYDVLVVGGGHAGCEAAVASANMGAKTCLITMDMNKIGQMSCNPAVGGIAKGQIVREIDAMGGEMGHITDATAIQFRMLNRSKGPAVWSPRAQCDRGKFIWQWRTVLDNTPDLDIWQDQASELIVENGAAVGVKTVWGVELHARCVVVTAGTFLNGLMHIGRHKLPGGRIAEPAVTGFTESITRHGIRSARMKTGTPVRIDKRSVHFEDMEIQEGESDFHQFSFMGEHRVLEQLPEAHETLMKGLPDSPLYNGQIQSIGPRYCPSVETKLMTFPDKEQHPLFLEPEGETTNEMYLNGFSSSMPMEVQIEALKKIPALRDVKVYRPGYAIEYDFFDPTQLNHSLESKIVDGLFFAGQVNGTTGYEEAGGQGMMAGINAALKCSGGSPFIRTIPYVHEPRRIQNTSATGRCRRKTHGEGIQHWRGEERPLRLVDGEEAGNRKNHRILQKRIGKTEGCERQTRSSRYYPTPRRYETHRPHRSSADKSPEPFGNCSGTESRARCSYQPQRGDCRGCRDKNEIQGLH